MGPAASMTRASAARCGAVTAADDEPDLCVQPFDAAIRDAVLDGVEHEISAVAHGAGGLDEGRESGALCSSAPPVQQHLGMVAAEVASQDRSELFFHLISPPDAASVAADAASWSAWLVVRSSGFFNSAHREPLKSFAHRSSGRRGRNSCSRPMPSTRLACRPDHGDLGITAGSAILGHAVVGRRGRLARTPAGSRPGPCRAHGLDRADRPSDLAPSLVVLAAGGTALWVNGALAQGARLVRVGLRYRSWIVAVAAFAT